LEEPGGEECDYIIVSDPELTIKDSIYQSFLNIYRKNKPKSLLIFPYSTDSESARHRLKLIIETISPHIDEATTVFVGDVFGPRVNLSYSSTVVKVLTRAKERGNFSYSERALNYYPVDSATLSKEIVKSLFSFGPRGGSLGILGPAVSQEALFQKLRKYFPSLTISYDPFLKRTEVSCESRMTIQGHIDVMVKESLDWLEEKTKKPEREIEVQKLTSIPKKKGRKKRRSFSVVVFGGLSAFFLVFVLPFFLLLFSGFSLFFVGQKIKEGRLTSIKVLLPVSKTLTTINQNIFEVYSKTPWVGEVFYAGYGVSKIVGRTYDLIESGLGAAEKVSELISDSLGREDYNPSEICKEIEVELDWIYKESGFLQGEIFQLDSRWGNLAKKYFSSSRLDDFRETLWQLKTIFSETPTLLGSSKPASYLILFQNNMELRPTGGFIGSFALIDFDRGRLKGMSVYDVYSADGQLKGHVEPPSEIKEYLGEANWYLRDSNWDADFPTSATRAEWFLGKEMDKSVEGVIAVDLEVAKRLLKILGPISLADFNEVIDYTNLYEKTQKQVEENFFPGSYKKTNFLTSLAREIINRLVVSSKEKYPLLIKSIWESLAERHIQIFFHNSTAQRAIGELGFDGEVKQPSCEGNCYTDWLGIIDANVGVNKANYFLTRNASLSVYLSGDNLKRYLTIQFKNKAVSNFGEAGRYKSYLRIMIPADSQVNDVEIASRNEKINLKPTVHELKGRKEIGVLIEVLPNETKEAVFSWEEVNKLAFNKSGEYRLYWRKQAGTEGDLISIALNFPRNASPAATVPAFTLTEDGTLIYNTSLTRDLFSRIIW